MGCVFFPLSPLVPRRERIPRILCAHCALEPTPSPSQEGNNTTLVPLLGGVRGGLVGARFMGRGRFSDGGCIKMRPEGAASPEKS